MTHKEEMEYLKKHDPILYSELTEDPTHGSDSGEDGCLIVFVGLLIIAALNNQL